MTDAHPRHRLDDVIHAPVRLSIVAALAAVDKADFGEVRDAVEITDSALSKQVATLEGAGYVDVSKGRVGRRPRTWLALTTRGRQALTDHLAALSAIAGGAVEGAGAGASEESAAGAAHGDRVGSAAEDSAVAFGAAGRRPPRATGRTAQA